MEEHIHFLNMFSDYEPQDDLRPFLLEAEVLSADIDPAERRVSMSLGSRQYIPQRILDRVSEEVCLLYQLRSLQILATHPADQLSRMEPDDLMDLFVRENSMARGSLSGAKWTWEDTELTVELLANGKDELVACVPAVRRNIMDRFGVDVSIVIHAGQKLEGQALFAAMEKMRAEMLSDLPKGGAAAAPQKQEEAKPVDTIFGKPFKGKAIPMEELSLDMGFVIVEGRVFNVEHKELTKRNAWVIGFDVTDNTSSVHISRFLENKEAKPILEGIKKDAVVRIQGKLVVDNVTLENYWDRKIPIFPVEQIELQCHGDPIEFKNIYIREL